MVAALGSAAAREKGKALTFHVSRLTGMLCLRNRDFTRVDDLEPATINPLIQPILCL